MRIAISFWAALFFVGTDLLARAANQGVEQALFSTVLDYSWNGIQAGLRLIPVTVGFDRLSCIE
jgi:hypothetical protein